MLVACLLLLHRCSTTMRLLDGRSGRSDVVTFSISLTLSMALLLSCCCCCCLLLLVLLVVVLFLCCSIVIAWRIRLMVLPGRILVVSRRSFALVLRLAGIAPTIFCRCCCGRRGATLLERLKPHRRGLPIRKRRRERRR